MLQKKILVIDDESQFVGMVKMRLESAGYLVITALDGQEGVVKAKQTLPDLILIDIMMPKMNGGEAVRLLKTDSTTCGIPVVFLTAVLEKAEEDKHQKINIDNKFYPAISKPFMAEHLLSKIQEYLLK